MPANVVHSGHIRIIRVGAELGEVVTGLNTDEVIAAKKKHQPVMHYAERLEIIRHIKGVSSVISQETDNHRPNLLKLKADYVVHGDDRSDAACEQVQNALEL